MCAGHKCLCDSCANNVDNIHSRAGEADEPCFYCEEKCYLYAHERGKYGLPKRECQKYKETEYHANIARKKFRIL